MKEEERKSFIRFISTGSSRQLDYVLNTLTKYQLQVVTEVLFNVVNGVCPIYDKNKTRLMKQKRLIRNVLFPGLTVEQRRRRLFKIKSIIPINLEACLQYGT